MFVTFYQNDPTGIPDGYPKRISETSFDPAHETQMELADIQAIADSLEVQKNIWNKLIMKSNSSIESQFTSEGIRKVVTKADIDSSSTWLIRGSFSDSNLSLPQSWVPSSGKKLSILYTKLIISNNVVMDKTLNFIGTNAGDKGDKNFTRVYNSLNDYLFGCDKYKEFENHKEFLWIYEPCPIILKSSKNAKIEISLPDGIQTGTFAMVKLKCISEDE